MFILTIKCYSFTKQTEHEIIWDCVTEINDRLEGVADIDYDEVESIIIERID